jgi:methyl-accepting chemotaxis protein
MEWLMLESWSISRRIAAGFVVLIALIGGLSVFAHRSVATLGADFDEYREISTQARTATAYMEDLFEGRIASFRYRVSANEADRIAVRENMAEIYADDSLVGAFSGSPDRLETISDIRAQAAAYADAFDQLAVQVRTSIGHRDDFNTRSETLDQQINTIFSQSVQTGSPATIAAAGRSLQDLMQAIMSGTEYLRTKDAADLAAAQEALSSVERSLRQLEAINQQDIIADQIADLRQTYDGYGAVLAAYSAASTKVIEIESSFLDRIGPDVGEQLDALAQDIVDRQQVIGPEGAAIVDRLLMILPVVGLLATITGLVAAFLIGRWIGRSVGRLADTTDQLAGGNNDVEITGVEHDHELGRMARALKIFKEAQIERAAASAQRQRMREEQDAVVGIMKAKLADLATGNLKTQVTESFAADYEDLRVNFNAAVKALDQAISDVAATGKRISATSEASQSATVELSQRTENQAATLEETAAALDELTASVKQAADHARSVDASVGKARQEAERNGEVVAQAVSAMSEIEQSASQIARVIGVIDDIAFQTNLLALNAGVEAARAGESGRGFAVVASEVRALAQRSAEAAKEISALIANSSRHVEQGTALVGHAGDALGEIITQVNDIAQMTSQIAASAEEQATGLSEINIGVNQLDQVTQQNAAMVQDSLSRGEDLAAEAARLGSLMGRFAISGSVFDAPSTAMKSDALALAIAGTSREGSPSSARKSGPATTHSTLATGTEGKSFWEDF